jgi:hypothetical protein
MEPFNRALVVPIRISPGIAHLLQQHYSKQKINGFTEINQNIQHSKPKIKKIEKITKTDHKTSAFLRGQLLQGVYEKECISM